MLDKEEVLQIINDITWGDDLVGGWHIPPDDLLEEIEKLPVYEDTELLKEVYDFLNLFQNKEEDKELNDLFVKLKERLDIK